MSGLLEALARALPGAPAQSRWFDAAELLLFGARDRVVVDADHFSVQDIGIVRRFLLARPQAQVEVVSSDRRSATAAELLALPGTQWHAWPPDLSQLEDFLRPAPSVESPGGSVSAGPISPPPPRAAPAEAASAGDARAPLLDLMGQVRRATDAHLALRGMGVLEPGPSENLAMELLRLERSVRGLLLAAERAPKAAEDLDLDALVEEELAVLALQSRRAPRVRYQGGEVLPVRVDRAVLVHALGVLLELVRTLAGSGELVEVRSLRAPGERESASALELPASSATQSPRAVIRLRAPAGALAALLPQQVFQPAGLGDRLPGFGPSELHSLLRLCAGRGLVLQARLVPGSAPQAEFELDMPIVERPARLLTGSLGG